MWEKFKNFIDAVGKFLDKVQLYMIYMVMYVGPFLALFSIPYIWISSLGGDEFAMRFLATLGCLCVLREILLMWKRKLEGQDPRPPGIK